MSNTNTSFHRAYNAPWFPGNRAQDDSLWKQKQRSEELEMLNPTSSYAYPHSRSSANGHVRDDPMSTDHTRDTRSGFLGNTEDEEDLPFYKDKPNFPSRRRRIINLLFPSGRRRRWLILGVVLFLVWMFISSLVSWLAVSEIDWNARSSMVRHVFVTSWEDYAKYAWGKDDYSPISRNSKFIVRRKGERETVNSGAGWIIVDALDTAMMMNLTSQVAQARKWIETSLSFSKLDGEINTFETTIRVLGGLLSAHYLSTTFPSLAPQRDDDFGQKGEDLYIEKAVDLADRLLGAFDTPTGIPYTSVNLNTSLGIPSNEPSGASSTAEAASLQLEMKYVSILTGEPLYWTMAEKVMQVIDAPRKEGGLVPIFVDPDTGKFRGHNLRLGSRGDSYYEYLLKQYLQTGELIYKEMWEEALEGIKRYMITWSENAQFTILAERPEGINGMWSGKMDHLVCFLPGTIALGVTGGLTVEQAKAKMGDAWGRKQEENLILAEELMKTCWAMYAVTPTGLAPEIAYFQLPDDPIPRWNFTDPDWTQPRSQVDFENMASPAYKNRKAPWREDIEIQRLDVHNLQRPESVESLYYLWRITGKQIYRNWGWRMFTSFVEYTKVVDRYGAITGYTSLESVLQVPPRHLSQVVAGSNVAQHFAGHHGVNVGRDNMEGFWMAETLKYFFLLFDERQKGAWDNLTNVVVNTEAHFFPRFDFTGHKVFKTGWTRKDPPKRVPFGEPGGGILKGEKGREHEMDFDA